MKDDQVHISHAAPFYPSKLNKKLEFVSLHEVTELELVLMEAWSSIVWWKLCAGCTSALACAGQLQQRGLAEDTFLFTSAL